MDNPRGFQDCPEWWVVLAMFVVLVVTIALTLYNHYTLRDQMDTRMQQIETKLNKVEELRLQILDDLGTITGKLNAINAKMDPMPSPPPSPPGKLDK